MFAQPAFLRRLAREHRQPLVGAGICSHGLLCMEQGMLPHDQEGRPYPVEIVQRHARCGAGEGNDGSHVLEHLVLVHRALLAAPASLDGHRLPFLFPDHIAMAPEELARTTWLDRAEQSSDRYQAAAQALAASPPDRPDRQRLLQESFDARGAEAKMWAWAAAAHREKDPAGFEAALDDPLSVPDQETSAFFEAWHRKNPYLGADLGRSALTSTARLQEHAFAQLVALTEFALVNYASFDHVALDVPCGRIMALHARLQSMTMDQPLQEFTRGDIASLVQLLGQIGQTFYPGAEDTLSITRDQVSDLEDLLCAAAPFASGRMPGIEAIVLKRG